MSSSLSGPLRLFMMRGSSHLYNKIGLLKSKVDPERGNTSTTRLDPKGFWQLGETSKLHSKRSCNCGVCVIHLDNLISDILNLPSTCYVYYSFQTKLGLDSQ